MEKKQGLKFPFSRHLRSNFTLLTDQGNLTMEREITKDFLWDIS